MVNDEPIVRSSQELFREILFNNNIEDRDDIYSLIYVRLLLDNTPEVADIIINRDTLELATKERIKESTVLNRNTRQNRRSVQ